MPKVVEDSFEFAQDTDTAKDFAEAFDVTINYADNEEVAERAERVVMGCLSQAETYHQNRRSKWQRMDKVYGHHSLSWIAEERHVHMGGPFVAVEKYAASMTEAFFGNPQGFIRGYPEEYGPDNEKGRKAARLVEEQMCYEACLPKDALTHFREVGIYGVRFGKVVPVPRTFRRKWRNVESLSAAKEAGFTDRTVYRFSDVREKEMTVTTMQVIPIHPNDFRADESANDLNGEGGVWQRQASWCGDYSYPLRAEVEGLADLGQYSKSRVNTFFDEYSTPGVKSPWQEIPRIVNTQSEGENYGAQPATSPHLEKCARFEWWGDFDLEDNGNAIPCVITILVPEQNNTPYFKQTQTLPHGRVVAVRENPYYHQRKPYVFHPFLKRDNLLWAPSAIELAARHSKYVDELASNALNQSDWESRPITEVGLDAETELEGIFPGAKIPVAAINQIRHVEYPRGSGNTIQVLEYFSAKDAELVGLDVENVAPRVAAAGVLQESQQVDMRTVAHMHPYEKFWIEPIAQFFHDYNGQFMTAERALKTLGPDGQGAPDIRIVNPTDVGLRMRFEATASRQIVQKAFQGQQLLNLLDRVMVMNQQRLMMGMPPIGDEYELLKRIMHDLFGIQDYQKILLETSDPTKIKTAFQEHSMIAAGERPGIQRGENTYMHAMSHMMFLINGGASRWTPENRQYLVDHAWETLEIAYRMAENAAPDVVQMMQGLMGQADAAGMQPTNPTRPPSNGGGAGGRGVAAMGGQQPGSPLIRRPTPFADLAGNSMQRTANTGAQ